MPKIREILEKLVADNKCQDLTEQYKEELDEEVFLPSDAKINEYANIFSVLSNPNRLKIIYLLLQKPMPVCFLASLLGLDQTLVSHHLSILRKHGIVEQIIKGKYRFYYVSKQKLFDILASIFKEFELRK
ncbi:winged helix-turn-helix transcriptional regulator [Desulfurococcaceae archaeon MEX13E-LK6-19]|nr:winged helix-turn-helix transcriptional regulator [Desulfurococcaceae archaeon MEX13E-LK6-19]